MSDHIMDAPPLNEDELDVIANVGWGDILDVEHYIRQGQGMYEQAIRTVAVYGLIERGLAAKTALGFIRLSPLAYAKRDHDAAQERAWRAAIDQAATATRRWLKGAA